MLTETFKISGAIVKLYENGYLESWYGDKVVKSFPQDNDSYRERAKELNYGDDTLAMSIDHELVHHLLSHWLELEKSPTLDGVSKVDYFKNWHVEESAVLAIQKYARLMSVDIKELVRKTQR